MVKNHEFTGGAEQNPYSGSEWQMPFAPEGLEDREKLSNAEAREVGEKVIMAANTLEAEAAPEDEPIGGYDKFGGEALSSETQQKLAEEGVTENPADAELAERLEAARQAPVTEIGKILKGESVEGRIDSLRIEEGKWSDEVAAIEQELGSRTGVPEAGTKDYTIAKARLAGIRAELVQLEQLQSGVLTQLDEAFEKNGHAAGGDAEAGSKAEAVVEEDEASEIEKNLEDKTIDEQIKSLEEEIDSIDRDIANAEQVMHDGSGDYGEANSSRVDLLSTRAIMATKLERLKNERDRSAMAGEVNDKAETSSEIDTLSPESSQAAVMLSSAEQIASLLGDPSLVARVQEALANPGAHGEDDFASTSEGAMPVAEEFASDNQSEMTVEGEVVSERERKVTSIMEKLKNRVGNSGIGRRVKRMAARAAVFALTVLSGAGIFPSFAGEAGVTANDTTQIESTAQPGGAASFENYNADYNVGVGAEALNAIDSAAELHEAENGTLYNYATNYDSTNKRGLNAFGEDKTENHGNITATKESILSEATQSPEMLASLVASTPVSFGLESGTTAQEIDEQLSKADNGGELQAAYLDKLKDLLSDEEATFKFIRCYDIQKSYIITKNDSTSASTPKNLEIRNYNKEMQRHGDKQVIIAVPIRNENGDFTGKYEYLQLNESCGYQPVITIMANPENPEDPVVVEESIPNEQELKKEILRSDIPDTIRNWSPIPSIVPEIIPPRPPMPPEPEPEPEPEPVKPKDPNNLYDHTAGEGLEGNLEQNEDITEDGENQGTDAPIINSGTDGQTPTQNPENQGDHVMTDQEILDYLDQLNAQGDSGFDN